MKLTNTSNWVIAFLTFVNLVIFGYSILKPFDKENIQASCADEMNIDHYWGNLNFYHYFHIRNSGEKQGVVTYFKGLIISKDNSSFNKQITGIYAYDKGTNYYYPNLNMTLNPNDIFNSTIQFFKESSKEEKDSIAYYENLKQNEIDELEKKAPIYDYKPKEVSKPSFNKMKSFMERNGLSNFKEGTYNYIVALKKGNEKKPFFYKCYSFVVYKQDISQLNELIKNYSKGGGSPNLYMNRRGIRVNLNEIQNPEVVESLLKQLSQTD